MSKIAYKQLSVEVPYCNSRDVAFLYEIRQAHNHDKLSAVSADIEKAFKSRIEDEFLGQEVSSKTRANITEFCHYLLSISKFFGYSLLASTGFVTAIHKDVLSIKTQPKNGYGYGGLLEAVFTYFDGNGDYKLTADGLIRSDLLTSPDDPMSRRTQILRDNNGTLPGFCSEEELCEECLIHVEISGQLPLLILPVE